MTAINSELIIDSKLLRENISYIKSKLRNESKFMAVIKSDAYGHNLESVTQSIDDLVEGYGVVRINEAKKIRNLSKKKILLMQGIYSHEEFIAAKEFNLDVVVHNQDQFKIFKENNYFKNLWLKVNTGMNRLGFEIDDFMDIYNKYLFDKKFVLMTHLAASNDKESISNHEQFKAFEDLTKKMHENVEKSIANTGCILNFPQKNFDWVRSGIGLYGGFIGNDILESAMTFRSQIIEIKNIRKGDRVGYNGRVTAPHDMNIAIVYAGYADGLPQATFDNTKVLINNISANIFGQVSMDLLSIDITNIPNSKIGDWCIFWDKNNSIKNLAMRNNLISYELMTRISPRVKVIYKNS